MASFSRREFLAVAGLSALAGNALAIPPFDRVNPRITGLGLTTYSLKPHMKWFYGKETQAVRREPPGAAGANAGSNAASPDGSRRAATSDPTGKLTMLDFLDYCGKLGLEAAELTSYFFETPVQKKHLAEIKRRALLNGLQISGGAMGNNFTHAPGSEEAKKQMAYFREWIDHFADLGAPVVRVFAGTPAQGISEDDAIKHVLANLEEALPYAEKRGVLLGMENHDLVKNLDLLLRIVNAVDSRWFGVIWDSANLAPTPDPYAELARIAPFALVAQVKVMTRVNGQNTPADFGKLVKILRDAKFAGPLIFEYEEPEEPFEAIPRFVKQLRELVAVRREPPGGPPNKE